jgi:hypothetical protein
MLTFDFVSIKSGSCRWSRTAPRNSDALSILSDFEASLFNDKLRTKHFAG